MIGNCRLEIGYSPVDEAEASFRPWLNCGLQIGDCRLQSVCGKPLTAKSHFTECMNVFIHAPESGVSDSHTARAGRRPRDRLGSGPLDRPPGRPLDRPGDGSPDGSLDRSPAGSGGGSPDRSLSGLLHGSGSGSPGGSLNGPGGGSLDRLLGRPLDRPLYHTGGVPKSSCK